MKVNVQCFHSSEQQEFATFFLSLFACTLANHFNFRFQKLLELQLNQEFNKKNYGKYVVNNHEELAGYAERLTFGSSLFCYIAVAEKTMKMSADCLSYQNRTMREVRQFDVLLNQLTHFMPLVSFYTSGKTENLSGGV